MKYILKRMNSDRFKMAKFYFNLFVGSASVILAFFTFRLTINMDEFTRAVAPPRFTLEVTPPSDVFFHEQLSVLEPYVFELKRSDHSGLLGAIYISIICDDIANIIQIYPMPRSPGDRVPPKNVYDTYPGGEMCGLMLLTDYTSNNGNLRFEIEMLPHQRPWTLSHIILESYSGDHQYHTVIHYYDLIEDGVFEISAFVVQSLEVHDFYRMELIVDYFRDSNRRRMREGVDSRDLPRINRRELQEWILNEQRIIQNQLWQ